MCNHLEDVKKNCVSIIDRENTEATNGTKKPEINNVFKLDATPPLHYIIGTSAQQTGEGSTIKNAVVEFRKILFKSVAKIKGNTQIIDSLLKTSDCIDRSSVAQDTISWERSQFATKTLASLLANLSMVQSNIRLAEAETISQLGMYYFTSNTTH